MATPGRIVGMRRLLVSLPVAAVLFSGANSVAGATTLTVTSLADSLSSCAGAGSNLNCPSLRTAIVQANIASGSTIQFQSGLTGTIFLTSALPTISQSVTITGPGANTLTISGNSSYQILNISSGTVTISGLTFANGNAHGSDAGAILNSGALTLTNSAFSGNIAVNGGGAINSNATLTVTNSTFSGNSTTDAIPSNGAFGGGAILMFGAAMTVTNSTFSGNSTALWGGAIYADGAGATLSAKNNVFVGNTSTNPNSNLGAGIVASLGNADHNLYYQNLDGNGSEDDCNSCASNTNAITGSNPNLFPLGYYGGPTETMLPKPGSPAICAGSFADVPSGVATDQRGFLLTNSTCSNGGVDIGAVQSNYVQVTNTNDSGAGSLRAAINAAISSSGADIDFAAAVSGTITLASTFPGITKDMVILGPGASNLSISGSNTYQIFNIGSSSTVFLSGLTLANGNSDLTSSGGGAIYNGGTLTVSDAIFSGNSGNTNSGGGAGGAIDSNGVLAVTNCTFAGNSSLGGGAMDSYGTTTLTDSSFIGNSGLYGGGAIDNGGTTTVTNNTSPEIPPVARAVTSAAVRSKASAAR